MVSFGKVIVKLQTKVCMTGRSAGSVQHECSRKPASIQVVSKDTRQPERQRWDQNDQKDAHNIRIEERQNAPEYGLQRYCLGHTKQHEDIHSDQTAIIHP